MCELSWSRRCRARPSRRWIVTKRPWSSAAELGHCAMLPLQVQILLLVRLLHGDLPVHDTRTAGSVNSPNTVNSIGFESARSSLLGRQC